MFNPLWNTLGVLLINDLGTPGINDGRLIGSKTADDNLCILSFSHLPL